MKKLAIAASVAFSVVLSASAVASEARINPYAVTTHGIKSFGFKLFGSLYEKKKGEDPVALSPLSVSEALTLAMHGANGETLDQLEGLFATKAQRQRFGIGRGTYTYGISRLREDLKKFAEVSGDAFVYNSANSLWANDNEGTQFEFTPEFLKTAGEDFGATLEKRDFAVDSTVDEMNEWVAKETKDKITKLLSQLGRDDVAVILNAIYAKGKFKQHFGYVAPGDYVKADGTTVPVSLMEQKIENLPYGQSDDAEIFSLKVEEKQAFKKGSFDQIALDVIVPKDGDIKGLVSNLNAGTYDALVASLEPKDIELVLPAGKVEQKDAAKLKNNLQSDFKVTIPFSDAFADFKALGREKDDRNIYINDILTKTFYEVTPFGFEAAAATAIVFARESAILQPPHFERHELNRPALHVIRHVPTGTPLFIIEQDAPKLYTEEELVKLVLEGQKSHARLEAKVADGILMVTWDQKTGKQLLAVVNPEDGRTIVRKIQDLK